MIPVPCPRCGGKLRELDKCFYECENCGAHMEIHKLSIPLDLGSTFENPFMKLGEKIHDMIDGMEKIRVLYDSNPEYPEKLIKAMSTGSIDGIMRVSKEIREAAKKLTVYDELKLITGEELDEEDSNS